MLKGWQHICKLKLLLLLDNNNNNFDFDRKMFALSIQETTKLHHNKRIKLKARSYATTVANFPFQVSQ